MDEMDEWHIDYVFKADYQLPKCSKKRKRLDLRFQAFLKEVETSAGYQLINADYVDFINAEIIDFFFAIDTENQELMDNIYRETANLLEKYNLNRIIKYYME